MRTVSKERLCERGAPFRSAESIGATPSTFSHRVLHLWYATVPRLWSLSAVADQQDWRPHREDPRRVDIYGYGTPSS